MSNINLRVNRRNEIHEQGKVAHFPAKMRRFALRLSVLLVGLLTIHSMQLFGQTTAASLTGTVSDPSGAVIPGASVTVEELSTGTKQTTQTNRDGIFLAPLLPPGIYDLTISKQGFTTANRSGIELQINQKANIDFTLHVGAVGQTVQVSGSSPLLETQSVGLGTVIGSREVLDLPLNGRQFTQLLQLAPGTVPISVSQGNAPHFGGGSIVPSINGGSNRSNLFFIDGMYATDPFFTGFSISPSIDAIRTFQEQTHATDAQYGQSVGGTINVATKAGTNHFHGDAYEFFRNQNLDAIPYFNTSNTPYRLNNFGGTVGGPILKNKLFFFGYYEGFRQTLAANNFSILPTPQELGGDFSALLPNTVIYDPTTYNPATNTTQPFLGNIIPTNRLNQGVLAAIKEYVPAIPTTAPPDSTNYVNTANSTNTQNQWSIRSDYNVGAKDLVYGHVIISNATNNSPTALPTNAFITGFNGKNVGGSWIHTFSPSLVSDITGGWNYINGPQTFNQPNASQVFTTGGFSAGFTANPGGIQVPMIPGQHPSGFFNINSGWGPIGPDNLGQVSGNISKQAGRHALKFGAAYYFMGMYTNWAENDENYNQQATWNPCASLNASGACVGGGGNSLASMLLGLPVSAGRQLGNAGVNLRDRIAGIYAQDSWKVSNKIQINYGMRWDYTAPVTETNNRLSGFDIWTHQWYIPKGDTDTPSGPLPPGVIISPRNTITHPDYTNFSPRFGFDYLVLPKTLIRGGVGVFYDNWSGAFQAAQNARGAWPSGASQNVNNLNIAGITPGATAQNPFGTLQPLEPATPFPAGGGFLDTRWKNAYSWQWNLEIQQQLSNSSVFSVAYVGSSTSRGPIQVPFNVSTKLGPTQVLPFPNMSQFGMIQSISHMNYNAFQSKYERRYSNGLAVTGAFTYSKSIDAGCEDYWEGCNIQDPYNLRSNRSNSSLDVPVVLTVSAVYQLPFGKGKQFATEGPASRLLGGWQLNGILSARSGTPFTVTINFDNANANGGTQRPNQIGNPQGPKTLQEWFNTKAFAVAPQYTYGNTGRNSLFGPRYTDLDTSLFRSFQLPKNESLESRFEFFNVLNHPQFSNPDGTLEDATFGQIQYITGNPRELQLGLKYIF